MQQKQNPMSVRSKNAMAAALVRLMLGKKYLSISISDIAAASGYSRQAFYSNFQCKDDVVNYLLAGIFDKYARTADVSSGFLLSYFIFWDSSREFLSVLFANGLGALFQEHNRMYFMNCPGLDAQCDGADERSSAYIRAGIAGITYELLWQWVVNGRGMSVEELTALAQRLMQGQILSRS